MSLRVGAIDIGTNSVHLLIAEISPGGEVSVIEKSREQVELGAGGISRQTITPDAFERGIQALASFKQACDSLDVADIHCAATSAVREASNGAEFCRAVKERTGVHVRVISGAEEARMIYLGARSSLDFSRGRVLLFDLGGGSTEFILCEPGGALLYESLPLGHIRLTDQFRTSDPMSEDERHAIRACTRENLDALSRRIHPDDFGTMVGSSGAVRTLALLATLGRGDPTPEHTYGLVLHLREVEAFVDATTQTSAEELAGLPGMDPRRRQTMPAAAIVVQEVMRTFGKAQLLTSERSLLDGLLVDWMLRHRPEVSLSATVTDPRRRSVLAVLKRYGDDSDEHPKHVAELAMILFDQTARLHNLRIGDRRLLEFAAQLHDIGHHIEGKDHNKHGAYLIRHTRMSGFTAPEIAVMALLVRYHQGGSPKARHPEFNDLRPEDQVRVRVLSAMLRMADALDRGHQQNVLSLEVKDGPEGIEIKAKTRDAPDLERWAAVRRAEMFGKALGTAVSVAVERRP